MRRMPCNDHALQWQRTVVASLLQRLNINQFELQPLSWLSLLGTSSVLWSTLRD